MTDSPATSWQSQPHAVVERDGVRYTLLGTAHVSRVSVEAVEDAIGSGAFDTVAVELDPQRLQAISDPDALAKLNLVDVIRRGRVALFAANLALAAYQRRLAEQLGIEPGAELKRAVTLARERELPVALIDRDVGLTFKRASRKLGFLGRMKLVGSLLGGLMTTDDLDEDEIEKLKQGDMLESSFGEFAKSSPQLYEAIISERDRYMAAKLREQAGDAREVLAVVGAGHLAGLARHLADDTRTPAQTREELEHAPPGNSLKWVMTAITLLILAMIGWGYYQGGAELGRQLVKEWVVITASFAALGALAALSHPLGILAAAIAAPLKPIRPPGISPGLFSALVEAYIRKPAYNDFLSLRDDAGTLRGWYRNRVSRTILSFLFANLGSSIGVWVAGLRIAGKVFS
jgi:pheromone shutdown-related protein TraB